MSVVIKAADAVHISRDAVFNFDDLARQAEDFLGNVRRQAAGIVAGANQEAKRIQQHAEAEGRRNAERAIDQKLDQKVALRMQTALPALAKAADELLQARHAWQSHWESRAVHLACAIAEKVIRRRVALDAGITVDLVREALDMVAGANEVVIRIHPADKAACGEHLDAVVKTMSRLAQATVVADETLDPGGCRVETRFGAIDQTFVAQLARIDQELTT